MTDETSPHRVRADLAAAHARVWDRLARAGTWLDGPTRIRVATETRHSLGCELCARCKTALSPYTVEGAHDSRGELPDSWIEMIHRIVADPGRLTHAWYRRILASGIADTEYVEIVSVIAHVTAVDTFALGLGIPEQPLPAPIPGAPSRYRPAEARQNEAWAPNIAWDEHGPNEADYFAGPPANIRRALSLVPNEARSFFDLVAHQYLPVRRCGISAASTGRSRMRRSSCSPVGSRPSTSASIERPAMHNCSVRAVDIAAKATI